MDDKDFEAHLSLRWKALDISLGESGEPAIDRSSFFAHERGAVSPTNSFAEQVPTEAPLFIPPFDAPLSPPMSKKRAQQVLTTTDLASQHAEPDAKRRLLDIKNERERERRLAEKEAKQEIRDLYFAKGNITNLELNQRVIRITKEERRSGTRDLIPESWSPSSSSSSSSAATRLGSSFLLNMVLNLIQTYDGNNNEYMASLLILLHKAHTDAVDYINHGEINANVAVGYLQLASNDKVLENFPLESIPDLYQSLTLLLSSQFFPREHTQQFLFFIAVVDAKTSSSHQVSSEPNVIMSM